MTNPADNYGMSRYIHGSIDAFSGFNRYIYPCGCDDLEEHIASQCGSDAPVPSGQPAPPFTSAEMEAHYENIKYRWGE